MLLKRQRPTSATHSRLGAGQNHRPRRIHVGGDERWCSRLLRSLSRSNTPSRDRGGLSTEQVGHIIQQVTGQPGHRPSSAGGCEAGRPHHSPPALPVRRRTLKPYATTTLYFVTVPRAQVRHIFAVATAVNRPSKADRQDCACPPGRRVEAGENLGFLPGDLQAKINPYFLRPLLDAIREMMDFEQVKRYMESDVIEVVPLAYMRGRTLNNAFIIMDEGKTRPCRR